MTADVEGVDRDSLKVSVWSGKVTLTDLKLRREAIYAMTKRISGTNRQKELKPFREGGKFSYSFEPGSRYLSWSEAGGGRDAAGGASKKFAAMSKATPPVSAASTTKASTVKAPDNATPQISEYAANKRGNNLGIVWND